MGAAPRITASLVNLERGDKLLDQQVILENVDGFEDPTHKFVLRSVPHVLSLKTSIAADVADGTTNPPVERTGWGGDGAPDNGSATYKICRTVHGPVQVRAGGYAYARRYAPWMQEVGTLLGLSQVDTAANIHE